MGAELSSQVRPWHLRDAKIVRISRCGEDEAIVELENGKQHELRIDDLIDDWLTLHGGRQAPIPSPELRSRLKVISTPQRKKRRQQCPAVFYTRASIVFCIRPDDHTGDHRGSGKQWTREGVRVSPPTISVADLEKERHS